MKQIDYTKYASENVKNKTIDKIIVKRLLTYLNPYKFWVVLAILLLIFARGIEAWIPVKIGQIAQSILENPITNVIEKRSFYNSIIHSCFIILGWIFFNYILDAGNILIKNWIGQKAIFTLRSQVFNHIQHLSMSYFDKAAIGRLMTRTILDVDQINQLFSESVIPLIGSVILFIGILAGMFFLNWQVGLLFCFLCPLIWWLLEYFRINQRRCYDYIRSIVSAMNTFIQENLMGITIVRNFGLEKEEKHKFDILNKDYYLANLKTVHYFSFFFSGVEFLQNVMMISVFLLLVSFIPSGSSFQVGTYFTISIYSLMIFRPLLDLAERYNVLQSAMAAGERIFEVLDTQEEKFGPYPGRELAEIESIEFKNVWFAYEKENWILRGISFSLNKGESIALVGTTGSGKTSILNILMKFYPFQKGKILVNGHDINEYSTNSIREQFSIILQDPVIFSGSIFENITLYDPKISLTQVKESSDYVNLTPVINRFQDQYDHLLSERGSSLSVGEAQLISLARAVAHKRNALIFDEATANIDLTTESMIQNALKKILKGKTAIVIAHRLSTIQDVSRILVLRQGIIIESGTHEELIQAKGIYEKLYSLQFASGI